MKVLVDMNLSPRGVDLLSRAGFEAAHWSAIGKPDAPDVEIMALVAANGFVVLTNDLDFSAILAATRGNKPSVVQVRSDDLSPSNIGRQIMAALRQMGPELEEGALLTVDPKRTRLRLLPLYQR
jgi:predicted nuclease of predicted toxin-antitoxin system